ncbi:MAG: periplasmic heavy metal sensor [Acidobacteria bacterium]|nr:periplasmic heavy metal sensor [Acidobacteriota bacterium]
MSRASVLLLAAVLALPGFAAQDPQAPPTPPPARARKGPGDFKALGLTPEQREKIKAARQEHANDPEGRRKAVMDILTPEQREKLKEIRRHRREMKRAPQGD